MNWKSELPLFLLESRLEWKERIEIDSSLKEMTLWMQ